jgi:hypothetical protein
MIKELTIYKEISLKKRTYWMQMVMQTVRKVPQKTIYKVPTMDRWTETEKMNRKSTNTIDRPMITRWKVRSKLGTE